MNRIVFKISCIYLHYISTSNLIYLFSLNEEFSYIHLVWIFFIKKISITFILCLFKKSFKPEKNTIHFLYKDLLILNMNNFYNQYCLKRNFEKLFIFNTFINIIIKSLNYKYSSKIYMRLKKNLVITRSQ